MLVLRLKKNFAKGWTVQFLPWYCPLAHGLRASTVFHTNVEITAGRSIKYSLYIAPGNRKDKVV